MRRRLFDIKLYRLFLFLYLLTGFSGSIFSQSSCDPSTPSFTVNLAGNPGGTWTSNPPMSRNGHCCNVSGNDRCIEFVITLDVNSVGINFQIASGAIPPGALYYQIDCGPLVAVGSPICVNGPGPYRLTFCKPGNNANTYSITSIPKPTVSPTTTTSDGCNINIGSTGLVESSIAWTSISPGAPGQYNSYLSCINGCDTVKVTPLPGYPAYVDYKICGTPLGGACSAGVLFCDTIRVYFVPPIANSISPNPASYCANSPGVTLNSVINGGAPPYSFIWKNGAGIVVGNASTYLATSPGGYLLEVRDATYPGCPPKFSTVNVTIDPVPTANAGPSVTVCPGNPTVQLNGTVTNATGGFWSGGTGTFSPNASTLNAIYTPSASEMTAGIVVLTLSTTGMGACGAATSTKTIYITQPITITPIMPALVCYGQTATITASVTGGTPPYQFIWSNGSTDQTIYNVSAGTYSVSVTDATANACTKTKRIVLNQNPPISLTVPSNNIITCDSAIFINATASGGSGNFSYLWNTGEATSGITVNSGTYIVTANDAVGCQEKDTVTIQAAGSAINVSVNQPSTLCYNGTVTLTAVGSGGFGGYIYGWNSGQSSTSITVPAGNYCVTIEDTVGCLYTKCVAVQQEPELQVSIPTPSMICYGATTSVLASVTGGTPPYTYSWSTGETTDNITKPAGTYSVTVIDANSNACSKTASVTITQASDINLNLTSTPTNCYGGNNGTATVAATGGTPPYSYAWSPFGGNSTTAYLLNAGLYSVTVFDNKGCSKSGSVTVTQPQLLNATLSSVTNVTCAGNSNGTATINASGGTPGYTYLWSPTGETNSTSNSLPAGSNSVVIQDSKGCIKTLSLTITEPSLLIGVVGSSTNVSCNGYNNGSASVIVSGGTLPYNYTWLETGDNTSFANDLYTGVYNISITDGNGCATTTQAIITQPPLLTSSISSSSNISCNGAANGSATVSANGGSPGYTYSWSNSAGNSATASNLTPNSYSVSVTDIKGCQTSSTVLITQPPALIFAQASATSVNCAGMCNGQVSVVVSGGTGNYQYFWTPGNYTTSTVSNLCPGNYSVRVTDQNGCYRDTTLIINEPLPLQVIPSITGSNCSQPNGSAVATVYGGTQGYTYSWSTIPSQSTSSISSLLPGTYTIKVTDSKGCITQNNAVILNIPGVTTTIATSNGSTCYGQCNGSAQVSLSGGTGPFTYSWSTIPVQTNSNAINLCAGTYTVKVTGADGCSDTSSVTITQPQALTLSQTAITHVSCYGNTTGSVTATASGGTGFYNYTWNTTPVINSPVVTNMQAGNYIVTVNDASNCIDTMHVEIQQPTSPLQLGVINTNITCYGAQTGSATASVIGGTPGYTYSWSTVPSQTTPLATNLPAGTYSVKVTDNKGCTLTSTPVIITQPTSPLSLSYTQNNVGCFGNNTGSISATVSGGTPGYTYNWSTTPSQSTPDASNLNAGTYSLSVTDNNGCSYASGNIIVTQPSSQLVTTFAQTNVNCYGDNSGQIQSSVAGGTPPYTYNWGTTPTQSGPNAVGLYAGTYSLTVTDSKGCISTISNISITQPAAGMNVDLAIGNVSCYGNATGFAEATVTGGSAPYTYSWSTTPVQTTSSISSIPAGIYSVHITDQYGCPYTNNSIIISQPPAALNLSVSNTNINCNGNSTGTATATASGGTPGYTYSWSTQPFQNTPTASNLAAGTYSVSVNDDKGCVLNSQPIVVTQPTAPLTVAVVPTNINCFGGNTGSIQATPSGGTTPYTYSWSTTPVQTGSMVSNLVAGTYSVNITDSKGCIVNKGDISLSQPSAAVSVNIITTNVSCFGASTGTAEAVVAGGTAPYTYSWSTSPIQTTPTAVSLLAGTYSVSIIDNNGCAYINNSIIITQPVAALQLAVSNTNVNCYGGNTATATATVSGGTTGYTYNWNTIPSQNTPTATNLSAGSYSVVVTDANNCTVSVNNINITQPTAGIAVTLMQTNVNCYGNNTGSIQSTVTGGTIPYTYSWNTTPVQTGPSVSNLIAGTYSLNVSDSKGCTYLTPVVTITQPPSGLTVTVNEIDVNCYGDNTGSAEATVSGGTSPYTFSWNTTPIQNGPIASSLYSGTYSLMVTDQNGCSYANNQVLISQPSQQLNTAVTVDDVGCNGDNTGSATATVSGGTTPYTFSWSTIPVQTTAIASNLAAGTYSLLVTDNNGCTNQHQSVIVNQPAAALAVTTTEADILCYGQNTGSASSTATGGTSPYTYSWNTTPPQVTAGISNLAPGLYSVTVTDNKGCSFTTSPVQITQPVAGLSATSSVANDVSCYGGSNGSATVSVSGGTIPYSYSWNSSPFQTTQTATSLAAGNYFVKVTDGNGCIITSSSTMVSQPTELNANISSTVAPSCATNNGSATASGTGGTAPYNYSWNTSPSQTLPTASNLYAGTYMVTVSDLRGCRDSISVVLAQPQTVNLVSAGVFPTTCNGSCDGYAVVIAGGGTAPYSYSWSNGGTGTAVNNLCEGSYSVYIFDNQGCYVDTTLHVTSPAPIQLTSTVTPANCSQHNGSANVFPSGGMPSYSFSWNTSPPIYSSILNAIPPGDYTAHVTDARGCRSSLLVTVPNISGVQFATTIIENTLCKDSCNGTATVIANSGTGPYAYFWSTTPPQFTASAVGLCAGTYKATIRDNDGCWDTISVQIAEPEYINAVAAVPDTICIGQSATLTASVEGGNGVYTYNWNYGEGADPSFTVSPVVTTNYALLVTDTNGCRSQVLAIPLNVNSPIIISSTRSDSICPGELATISAMVTGGDGNYSYSWNPGNITTSSFQATPAATTNYTLIVKDGCGSPSATDSAKIVIYGLPQIAFTPDARSGCKPLCVNFTNTSTISGESSISNWNWSFSNGTQSYDSSPLICFNEDGTTDVRIEAVSNHGCKSTIDLQEIVEVYPDPVADFVFGPQPADILNPEIQFTDMSVGAVNWKWSFNDSRLDRYSSDPNPTFMYSDTGNFCPVLRVTSIHGCTSEKVDCLFIQPEFAFYIPNAFSPNGDGDNETFNGKGMMITDYEMMIFDRWGNLIFQSNDINKAWDGSANNGSAAAQEDVYIYRIKAWDDKRKVHIYNGHVTLVK